MYRGFLENMNTDLNFFIMIILMFLVLLGLVIKYDQNKKIELLTANPGCSYVTTLKYKVYVLDCQGKLILKLKNEN